MEFDAGLDRETAERNAFEDISERLRLPPAVQGPEPTGTDDFWDHIDEYLLSKGFYPVDASELDSYVQIPWPLPSSEEESDKPWRCTNRYCRDKGRWRKSVHGVINCVNCTPPGSPALVAETGTAEEMRQDPGRRP